ncbi:MAG: hypothetical protein JNJ99_03320 [Crocinitomicaceae bacterium]|nr:hypothetical protein [Crocinitomicaceae bacterium]
MEILIMEKFDKTIYGVIAGLILPIIGFFISYPIKKLPTTTFAEYVDYAMAGDNQQDILIFCLIPNMFLFYFTNFRWNTYNLTKGLVGVTLILGLLLFIITM